MSKLLIALKFIFFFFLSCERSDADLLSSTAILRNNIAVDGCEWHFALDLKNEQVQYAASDDSKTKMNAVIEQSGGTSGVWSIDVKIDYKITGKKKEVQCGWGIKQSMAEIEILTIKKI